VEIHYGGDIVKITVILGIVITLLLSPVVALLGCQQQPQPAQTPSPTPSMASKVINTIVFDPGFDIYAVNADDSNQSADDSDPSRSPDGSRITFTSDRDGKPLSGNSSI
jgi:hypothetical protein